MYFLRLSLTISGVKKIENEQKKMVDINAQPDLEKCSPSVRRRGIDEERPHPFAYEHRKKIDGKRPSAASWRKYAHAKVDRPNHTLNAQLLT